MRILKRVIGGLLVVIVVLLVIGWILPGTYKVERSVEIAATPEQVFRHIEDPRAWAKWTVWNERDPNMQMTYSGAEIGEGARWAWQSKSEGNGAMEFTRAQAPQLLEYKLSFPDFQMSSTGKLTLAPAGQGTRVNWTNEGDFGANPVFHYMALIMDGMVGPDFQAGLANLKRLSEGQSR